MTAGESNPGSLPLARAEQLVPGGNADELADKFPDDPEVQEAFNRVRASRDIAVAAFVAAEAAFAQLRHEVVKRTGYTIRDAGSQEVKAVGGTHEVSSEPQGE